MILRHGALTTIAVLSFCIIGVGCSSIGGRLAGGAFEEVDRWIAEPQTEERIQALVHEVAASVSAELESIVDTTLTKARNTVDSILSEAGRQAVHLEDTTTVWVRTSLREALSELADDVLETAGQRLNAQVSGLLSTAAAGAGPVADSLGVRLASAGGAATDTILAHLATGLDGDLATRLADLVNDVVTSGVVAADNAVVDGGIFDRINRWVAGALGVAGLGVVGFLAYLLRDRHRARTTLTVVTQAIEESDREGELTVKQAIAKKADPLKLRPWLDDFLIKNGISVSAAQT